MTKGGLENGLYLAADTPTTLHPVLTEGGEGERQLLLEELREHGIGTFGEPNYKKIADLLLETIYDREKAGDEIGAELGTVVSIAAEDYGYFRVLETLVNLARNGEIYAPSNDRLRTTYHNKEGWK